MSRFLIAALVGSTIASGVTSSASAFQCVASSPNGAVGSAAGLLILERARAIALRRCILAGGNLHGSFCYVEYCR
jgi:hypothetical protein